jgi:hypothetical protein
MSIEIHPAALDGGDGAGGEPTPVPPRDHPVEGEEDLDLLTYAPRPEPVCLFCDGAGCDICGLAPKSPRARTNARLREALRRECHLLGVEVETFVLGDELRVRLVCSMGEASGYSWIDLPSLDGHGRRPVDWVANKAIEECLHDLARYMISVGPVEAIRYAPHGDRGSRADVR